MRIDATSIANLVLSAENLSSQQTNISQQLASGVRLSALSDDPLAAGRSSTLAATLAGQDSFLVSASTVQSRTTTSDTALAAVVTQLTSAVSLAVQGANDTETTANRQSISAQLSSIRDTILTLANSSYGGAYLFAGSKSSAAPFTLATDGSVSYGGDTQTSSLSTLGGGSLPTSIAGSTIFADATSPVFASLQTAISALGNGSAVDTGAISALRASLNVVITQRSSLDSSLSRLNTETTYVTTQQANTKVEQSSLLAADPVSLATQLSASESQRSALLATLGKLQKDSLFDYL